MVASVAAAARQSSSGYSALYGDFDTAMLASLRPVDLEAAANKSISRRDFVSGYTVQDRASNDALLGQPVVAKNLYSFVMNVLTQGLSRAHPVIFYENSPAAVDLHTKIAFKLGEQVKSGKLTESAARQALDAMTRDLLELAPHAFGDTRCSTNPLEKAFAEGRGTQSSGWSPP